MRRPPISFSALHAQLIGAFWSFLIHSNLPDIKPLTSSCPLADFVGPTTAAASVGGDSAFDPDPALGALEPLEPLEPGDAAEPAVCSLEDFEHARRSEIATSAVRIPTNLSLCESVQLAGVASIHNFDAAYS